MPGNIQNENLWNKAKQAFKEAYKREPKSDSDWKIVMSTYQKMGGQVSKKSNKYTYTSKFEPIEIISKGEKKYMVEGYVSTIDEDLSNEYVTASAQRDIYNQIMTRMNDAIVTGDEEHQIYDVQDGTTFKDSIPKVKFVDAKLTEKGVWVKAELNQNHPNFKAVWGSIKEGFLNSFSITFIPLEAIKRKVNNTWKSFVNKLNLLNITLTGNPMNPNATFKPVMKSALEGLNDSFNTQTTEETNGDKMTEAEKKAQEEAEVEAPKVEAKSEEPVEEKPAVAKEEVKTEEAEPEAEVEKKSNNDSLIAELEEIKAELKALKEKPVLKAKVEPAKLDKKAVKEVKEFNVFNYIK